MKRIGFLCYDLQEFTTDCLNRIQDSIKLRLKAYPLFSRIDSSPKHFEYRTTKRRGVFFSVKRAGVVPEGFPLGLDISLAWSCVRQNDIVVLFGLQGATALAAAVLARLMGRTLISVNQTMATEWEARRSWWVRLLKKFLLKICHQHIYQTSATKRTLEIIYGLNPNKFHYAPFEAGAEVFESLINNQPCFRYSPDKKTRFLFVGTLLRYKGIPEIIKACHQLMEQKESFHLRIIGPAPQQKDEFTLRYYKDQIKNQGLNRYIKIVGPCPLQKLPKNYYWSDVLLLPTYRDMWPKVLVEAALCERPSITTEACGAAGELVIQGKTGWVIKPGNVDELITAMKFVIKNKNKAIKMGKAARINCLKLCNPKKEVKGYVSAINAVMRPPNLT